MSWLGRVPERTGAAMRSKMAAVVNCAVLFSPAILFACRCVVRVSPSKSLPTRFLARLFSVCSNCYSDAAWFPLLRIHSGGTTTTLLLLLLLLVRMENDEESQERELHVT